MYIPVSELEHVVKSARSERSWSHRSRIGQPSIRRDGPYCKLRKTDRQAGRQTDRQTGRQTDRQTDSGRQTNRQTDRQTDVYLSVYVYPV